MVAVESGGHGEETAARMLAFPSWMACVVWVSGGVTIGRVCVV